MGPVLLLKQPKQVLAWGERQGALSLDFLQYSREKLALKRDSMYRLLEAPGNHSDPPPTKILYNLTCFLSITFLLRAAPGSGARLVIDSSLGFSRFGCVQGLLGADAHTLN